MAEEFFKWFGDHYPTFFVILACCCFAVFVTVVLCKKYFHWASRIRSVESECGRIDNHLVPQLVHINQSLTTLNGSFNSLVVYLKGKDGKMDTSLFVSKSPIQLTELGERILVAIGGKVFIDNNAQDLIKEMDMQGIKTALDSQTFAPIVISQASNRASFNHIKDFTFKNPYYKEKDKNGNEISVPLDMGTITNIMGIYLRDKYLEKHPNLKPEDIPSIPQAK